MSNRRIQVSWTAVALLLGIATLMYLTPAMTQRLAQWQYQRTKPAVTALPDLPPQPVVETEVPKAISGRPTNAPAEPTLPLALNRTVPFTNQAPTGTWDAHHEEYCEEASALMVGRFFHGRQITNTADAEAGLVELERWEMEHFGFFESTTAEQTARMIREVYDLDATVQQPVTKTAIKQVLIDGGLVILPTAGRKLGNPYYKQPGPIYHMLVVKGYTANGQFITNDPGTKRGADYVYRSDILLAAVGDYNGSDPEHGAKMMIVVRSKD